jgi:hypothetical protein
MGCARLKSPAVGESVGQASIASCAVMRSEMSAGDAILHEPPKKLGASLTDPLQAPPLLMGTIMPKALIC